jgi:hypothetical protein
MHFTFAQPSGLEILPSHDTNIDLIIRIDDGRVYRATFFTVDNVKTLLNQWRSSGEYGDAVYLGGDDMVIVESISRELLEKVIAGMIETSEIDQVCVPMPPAT